MKIYVGNLSYDATEEELRQEFGAFGKVESAVIMSDRNTGQSKGFAFVEMPVVSEGRAAMSALNGKTVRDRVLTVDSAKQRVDNRGSGSYGSKKGKGFHGGGRGR
ncbi:RNA recognition motif domain-containing protein [Chloroflexota bacterium]